MFKLIKNLFWLVLVIVVAGYFILRYFGYFELLETNSYKFDGGKVLYIYSEEKLDENKIIKDLKYYLSRFDVKPGNFVGIYSNILNKEKGNFYGLLYEGKVVYSEVLGDYKLGKLPEINGVYMQSKYVSDLSNIMYEKKVYPEIRSFLDKNNDLFNDDYVMKILDEEKGNTKFVIMEKYGFDMSNVVN